MEWIIGYLIPVIISLIPSVLFRHYEVFIMTMVFWAVIELIIFISYMDDFDIWNKKGQNGDHPCFEWTLCKLSFKQAINDYNPSTYCKINFQTFTKYFQVNPKRYDLRPGYIVCDNENDSFDLRMIVPRVQLWKYYKFRRNYLQSRQMMNVIELVQSDIDTTREIAQQRINEAKEIIENNYGLKLDTEK